MQFDYMHSEDKTWFQKTYFLASKCRITWILAFWTQWAIKICKCYPWYLPSSQIPSSRKACFNC